MTRFTSFVNILRNWFGSCSCLVIQKLAGLFLKTSFSQIFLLAAKQRFVKLKNKRTSTAQPRSSAVRPSHHRRPAPCAPIAGRGGAGAAAAPSQDGGVRAGDEAGLQAPRRPRRRPRRHLAAAQVTGSAARRGALGASSGRLPALASSPLLVPWGHLGGRSRPWRLCPESRAQRCPSALLLWAVQTEGPQPLLTRLAFTPFTISVALLWVLSSSFMTILYCSAHT